VPALCLLALLLAAATPEPARTVWLLEQPEWKREKAALIESLLIYTRDLRAPITISMSPAAVETVEATHEALVQAARRHCDAGALLVLWFAGDKQTPALSIYDCEDAYESTAPLVPADDLDVATQALALRLRGMVARLPEPPPTPPKTTKPAPRAPDVQAQAQPAPPPHTWEVGVAGALLAASADSGLRPGVTVRAARLWSGRSLALEVDATQSPDVTYDALGYHATVRDWPFGVALAFRTQIGAWVLSGGPRASLHTIQAQGSFKDGRGGKSPGLAAGLGATGGVHYRIWRPLTVGMVITGELLIPRQHYSLDRNQGIDIGMSQISLAAGVVYSF
jgi:hypothetical protein